MFYISMMQETFFKLIKKGNAEELQYLLQKCTTDPSLLDVNQHTSEGVTGLQMAIENEDIDVTQMLLQCPYVNVNKVDAKLNWPPLFFCLSGGSTCYDLLKLILTLRKDCFLHHKDSLERTALHLVAISNLAFQAQLLIDYKADLNAKTLEGDTPLHLAIRHGSTEVALILIERNALLDVKNESKQTPLHLAVMEKAANLTNILLKLLEEKDIDFNSLQDCDGCTPLHIAVKAQHRGLIDLLTQKGFRWDLKNSE
ncbi:ankyrin repeat-containing protein, partial [Cardiosporidium cionae]